MFDVIDFRGKGRDRVAWAIAGVASGLFIHAVVIALCGQTVAAAEAETSAVIVQRVGRQCFVQAVHATGYIVPRATAVVMFNAPNFKISDVSDRPGDVVEAGAVVARAVPIAPRPGLPAAAVEIRAPAAGLVLASTAFVGKPTSVQAEPLFTLAVDGDMEVAADVPGTHVFEVKAGQVAHIGMRDGTVLDGHVRLAPPIIDRATQMGQARLAFDAGPARASVGRFIRATIEANRSCGVGVPRAAVLASSSGPRLQVVDHGVVTTRAVRLGLASDVDVEITDGLNEGDLVVANAGAALRDGDRVTPVAPSGQDRP